MFGLFYGTELRSTPVHTQAIILIAVCHENAKNVSFILQYLKVRPPMYGSKKTVALLPMKANSQRVEGKNFRVLHGKPLFRWILDSLLELKALDQIIINTDARSVLADNGLTESERVLIRDRKPELCGDRVSMNLILADDISAIEADTYVMTHTTNPMLSSASIEGALCAYSKAVSDGIADSLFSVNKVQTRFYRADCSAVNHDPANLIQTQDLEPWYEDNSNLYIFSKTSFSKTNARIGQNPIFYETPQLESVDIDTPTDWDLAECVATLIAKRQRVASNT